VIEAAVATRSPIAEALGRPRTAPSWRELAVAGALFVAICVAFAPDAATGAATFWAHDFRHHHDPWRAWAATLGDLATNFLLDAPHPLVLLGIGAVARDRGQLAHLGAGGGLGVVGHAVLVVVSRQPLFLALAVVQPHRDLNWPFWFAALAAEGSFPGRFCARWNHRERAEFDGCEFGPECRYAHLCVVCRQPDHGVPAGVGARPVAAA
jgi:hypothetical protein